MKIGRMSVIPPAFEALVIERFGWTKQPAEIDGRK